MGEDLAALYLGISLTSFRERVQEGAYPQPKREGRRLLWARRQLDLFVDAQFNLPQHDAGSGDSTWDDLK